MKLLLRFAASILFTSVYASGSPYHEIVGVGQSTAPHFVAPVYGVAPAISLLPPETVKEGETVVAGPVTGITFVEGSSSGPVTIVSPGGDKSGVESSVSNGEESTDVPRVPDDSVLVRGASSGPVTLVAPSDNSVAIGDADNATSAGTETKKGVVAASAEAAVAIENAEESSNATAIKETIGIVSANAIIGPSTGPIVIAGPTAPPLPIAIALATASSVIISSSMNQSAINVTSDTIIDETVSGAVTEEGNDGITSVPEATEPTSDSATTSNSLTNVSGDTVTPATTRVNLIPSEAAIAVGETPLSNVVVSAPTEPSAVVSGPTGSVSAASSSSSLFNAPLYSL